MPQPRYPREELRNIAQIIRSRMSLKALRECLFCKVPLQNKPIRGHSIQRAMIKKFLAERGHVIMINNYGDAIFSDDQNPEPSAIARLVGVNQATTGYFTCPEHERLFDPIEREPLELHRSKTKFLFALRAVAFQTWRLKVARDAWRHVYEESPIGLTIAPGPLNFFSKSLSDIERALETMTEWYEKRRYELVKHKIVRLRARPTIAVSEWSAYGVESYLNYGLTVLPVGHQNTTAIFHYFEEESENFYAALGHLEPASLKEKKHMLSRVIIEDFENITVSPHAWNQFGPEKQNRITEHYMQSLTDPELHRLKEVEGQDELNFFID